MIVEKSVAPYVTHSSRLSRSASSLLKVLRRIFEFTLLASVLVYLYALSGREVGWPEALRGSIDWDERRLEVKDAFTTSWGAYAKHAWGKYFPGRSIVPVLSLE